MHKQTRSLFGGLGGIFHGAVVLGDVEYSFGYCVAFLFSHCLLFVCGLCFVWGLRLFGDPLRLLAASTNRDTNTYTTHNRSGARACIA
jgi:hypothetical protein